MSVQHSGFMPDPVPLRMDDDGTIRVGETRVLIDLVVHAYQDGVTPEEIVCRYPSLTLTEVYSTIAYYLRHQEALDSYLAERERRAQELRVLIEAHQGESLLDRLLARQKKLSVPQGE